MPLLPACGSLVLPLSPVNLKQDRHSGQEAPSRWWVGGRPFLFGPVCRTTGIDRAGSVAGDFISAPSSMFGVGFTYPPQGSPSCPSLPSPIGRSWTRDRLSPSRSLYRFLFLLGLTLRTSHPIPFIQQVYNISRPPTTKSSLLSALPAPPGFDNTTPAHHSQSSCTIPVFETTKHRPVIVTARHSLPPRP